MCSGGLGLLDHGCEEIMSVVLGAAQDWVALNKPAGIPVFPPHADPSGDCLLTRWTHEQNNSDGHDWPAGFEGGIAHRLDGSTSGQVLAAATPVALTRIRDMFRNGDLNKRYVFVSAGDVPWSEHTVQTPIAHDKRRRSRMIVQRGKSTPHRGRWYTAHTSFRRLGKTTDTAFLWEAVITTGVMHQIRVHAASVGIPLRGDKHYGGGTPQDESISFLLHHIGMTGPDFLPPEASVPDFWPIPE
jgi:23S rRNA pseudouridine1911/1915/1917 synthase